MNAQAARLVTTYDPRIASRDSLNSQNGSRPTHWVRANLFQFESWQCPVTKDHQRGLDQSAYDLEFIHHRSDISSCLLLMSQLSSKVTAMRHTEAATYPANISTEQVMNKYMRINYNSGQCNLNMSADRVLPRPDMTPNNEEHSLRPHRVRRRTHIFAASAI